MNKNELIKNILTILGQTGSFTTGDAEVENDPVYFSAGNTVMLVEIINETGVDIFTYLNGDENESDIFHKPYEELSEDLLQQILGICDRYLNLK